MRRLSCLIALLACLVLALPAFAAPQKADAISGISSEKVLDIVKANKGKLVFINSPRGARPAGRRSPNLSVYAKPILPTRWSS